MKFRSAEEVIDLIVTKIPFSRSEKTLDEIYYLFDDLYSVNKALFTLSDIKRICATYKFDVEKLYAYIGNHISALVNKKVENFLFVKNPNLFNIRLIDILDDSSNIEKYVYKQYFAKDSEGFMELSPWELFDKFTKKQCRSTEEVVITFIFLTYYRFENEEKLSRILLNYYNSNA